MRLLLLVAVVGLLGVGVGAAANPIDMLEHKWCQDPPDSAFINFDALYKDADGNYIYFAGGAHLWFYEVSEENPGDWWVHRWRGGYGRSDHAFEGTYEDHGDTHYLIADETKLTVYEKNRTAIGAQGAEKTFEAGFVANCYGEEDI